MQAYQCGCVSVRSAHADRALRQIPQHVKRLLSAKYKSSGRSCLLQYHNCPSPRASGQLVPKTTGCLPLADRAPFCISVCCQHGRCCCGSCFFCVFVTQSPGCADVLPSRLPLAGREKLFNPTEIFLRQSQLLKKKLEEILDRHWKLSPRNVGDTAIKEGVGEKRENQEPKKRKDKQAWADKEARIDRSTDGRINCDSPSKQWKYNDMQRRNDTWYIIKYFDM